MKITYNKNPLYTIIELDEFEKKELWYKIKIEEIEELLFDAHFHLQEGKYFDLKQSREAVNPNYYLTDKNNEKSQLEERCDELLSHYLTALVSCHIGDCTCIPCSCSKCHVESLLGIDTIPKLGKHSASKINSAFGKNNEKTIEEAIYSLKNFNPIPTNTDKTLWERVGGYESHIPRWTAEAKLAHDWLVDYDNHFIKGQK